MRKLQYLFMTLSALFLAVPAFAVSANPTQTTTGYGLMTLAVGVGMGSCRGTLRTGSGTRHRFGNRSPGPQPGSARRNSASAGHGPRLYRIAYALYHRHGLPQGQHLDNKFYPRQRAWLETPESKTGRPNLGGARFCFWGPNYDGILKAKTTPSAAKAERSLCHLRPEALTYQPCPDTRPKGFRSVTQLNRGRRSQALERAAIALGLTPTMSLTHCYHQGMKLIRKRGQ